jgi:hypothetical protein
MKTGPIWKTKIIKGEARSRLILWENILKFKKINIVLKNKTGLPHCYPFRVS